MIHKKCIYCLTVELTPGEWSGEHVFPALLGCPDAYQLYRYVCPNCNTVIFSKLEDAFKQHSPEGYLAATWKLGRGSGYRTTGTKLKVRIFKNEVEISSDYLYSANLSTRQLSLEPQTAYIAGSKKIVSFKTMSDKKKGEAIKWMRSPEIEELTLSQPPGSNAAKGKLEKVKFELVAPLDLSIQRVIAKIAFNYFAYCAMPQYDAVVYDNWFSALRTFVLSAKERYDATEFIPTTLVEVVRQSQIRFNGNDIPAGHPFHSFRIRKEPLWCHPGGMERPGYFECLVVYVNLFSLREYRVRLSFFPFSTVLLGNFGVNHIVDLNAKQFVRVASDGTKVEPNDFRILR